MKSYSVSFQYSEYTWCSNIAMAEDIQDVKDHYSKYDRVSISECADYEVTSAKRKGMPIIYCGAHA